MADGRPKLFAVLAFVICFVGSSNGAQQYLGKFLGKLSELHHGVSGEVYAVDARTLHLKDFTYDGEGPAAYFWAGSTRTPGSAGFRVRDENGNPAVLKRYRRKSITITLPDGKTLNNIKWFSVWCEEFAVNFGDVKIPRNFDYPKPQKINGLQGVHGVSSDNIVIVDAQTLLIPNFSYDGEAPDAKFWVGRGSKPGPQGYRVPDENGKEIPLRRYDRKTVVLTLPGDLTVFDIGHFGVWCEAFTVDFGHVRIPQQLNVPPSLKMLGVSPQSKLNCEVLYDDLAFEVRWAVAGESIVLQLVAKLDNNEYMSFGLSGDNSKTEMIGGDVVVAWVDKETLKGYAQDYFLEDKSQCSGPRGSCPDEKLADNTNNIRLLNAAMVNGYSIVTYQRPLKSSDELDKKILTNQSQAIIWAIGPLNQRNEVSFHSHYTKKNHFIDFGRPAKWNCPMPESDSSSSQSQQSNIPATVQTPPPPPIRRKPENHVEPTEATTRGRVTERRRGGNREVSERRRDQQPSRQSDASSRRRSSSSNRERGTTTTTERALRTVPTPKPVTNRNAWHIPPIECYEPDDQVYYAQMGPTGGKHGYPAITGHVGWGISWYINGLLIPEINVVRGQTYTFVVEGGLDPDIPAKYHPFYITDDPVGGYEHKTPEERQNITIFAGAKRTANNKVVPTGVGRLCNWIHTGDREADEFESFGAFQRTLELRCDAGEPGFIRWTPDAKTPDTVYYQCFTHRYLGWKINVLDTCDETKPEGSDPEPALALPPSDAEVEASFSDGDNNGDLISSSSINVETRINPNDLFQTKHTDRPKQSERPADTDTNYLLQNNNQHDYSSGGDFITLDQQQQPPPDRTQNTDIHKNHFQSSPEIFFNPPPFKIIASESIESNTAAVAVAAASFKAENLTTTMPATTPRTTTTAISSTSTRNTITKNASNDISTSSAVTRTTSPPAKYNPVKAAAAAAAAAPVSFISTRHPAAVKPIFNANKMPQRRPIMQPNRPPFIIKPMMLTMHRPPPIQAPYKKSFYRIPLRKRPTMRPMNPQSLQQKSPFPKPLSNNNQEPIVIMKYQQVPLKVSPQQYKQMKTTAIIPTTSTQSSTTPKEIIDTKGESSFASELISVKKESPTLAQISTMRPAINTGFHPESVVIEGGFKPIITKEFQDRISDDEDLENAEQQENIGVILLKPENAENSQQFTESFEPMFIPSPPDSHLLLNKKQNATTKYSKRNPLIKKNPSSMVVIVKHVARSAEMDETSMDDEDDKLAMAAERVEAYYLPPDDRKTKPVDKVRNPSNIDIPPGAVVTFDGKTVSGVSLTAPINDQGSSYGARSSKAQYGPQFGPFRGEIPPLDAQSINAASLPQLNSQAVLNRDLNAPAPGPAAAPQQTTRLQPVRTYRQRTRRDAHHTPEHTAEQEKQHNHSHDHSQHHDHMNHTATATSNTHLSDSRLIAVVITISFLIKCINF